MSTAARDECIRRFRHDPKHTVLLLSYGAGAVGLNLQFSQYVFLFDRWWNPAKENQATDRLHRMGQTRGVQVFKLQMLNTVEERIAQIIQSKLALSDALIEESAAGLKAFSREELLELLRIPD